MKTIELPIILYILCSELSKKLHNFHTRFLKKELITYKRIEITQADLVTWSEKKFKVRVMSYEFLKPIYRCIDFELQQSKLGNYCTGTVIHNSRKVFLTLPKRLQVDLFSKEIVEEIIFIITATGINIEQ